jgi:protein KTI12
MINGQSNCAFYLLFSANEQFCNDEILMVWIDVGALRLQELVMRYEKPNGKNRWDSPLFTVKPSSELPLQEILDFVQSKQTVTQTMATQYVRATKILPATKANFLRMINVWVMTLQSKIQDTNFLYDLDKTTQEVVTAILEGQKAAMVGDEIAIPNASKKVKLMRQVTLAELRRIRKQYLTLTSQLTATKTNYNHQVDVYNAFVDYMNTSLNSEK